MRHEHRAVDGAEALLDHGFPGTPDGVRDALAALRARLEQAAVDPDAAFTAELLVAEALNNVVEHALAGLDRAVFGLAVSYRCHSLRVEIRDRGKPMPDGHLPAGRLPDITEDTSALPEGGFGWYMIRAVVEDLAYARVAGENRLSFRIPLTLAASV